MFVLVESGSVTKFLANNRGIQIGDLKYPAAIFTLWSESERNAIGVYEVEIDKTNFKDEQFDKIISSKLIHHLAFPLKHFKEVLRILKIY